LIAEALELRRLLRARFLSSDELRALQDARLRAIVRHAYEQVPYYKTRFRSVGLDARDVRGVDDLTHVPITTKQDLVEAGCGATLAAGVDPDACKVNMTSGSTGVPLSVYRSRAEVVLRELMNFRALLSAGLRARDRLAVLGPLAHRRRRFHERIGLFHSEHVAMAVALADQIAALQRARPTVLWGYPTALLALVEHTGGRLFEVLRPRFLITSAETFDPFLRERVLAGTSFPVLQFYGSHEAGRIAYECAARDGLHVSADLLLLECLDGDGHATRRGGEAVITHLGARAMPLIRYRLGDLVTWRDRGCACGSTFPTIDPPEGRIAELMRLPSGAGVAALAFGYVMRDFPTLRRFQTIQKALDHLLVLLVDGGPPGDRKAMESRIRERLLDLFREPVRIDVEFVDAVPEDRLKFRSFLSELD
jgi:phenylacetate-CoA ligase